MNSSPRRYCVDGKGQRVLVGLTLQETLEFEVLDELPADPAYSEAESARDEPNGARKKRWVELYTKHESAWQEWKTASRAAVRLYCSR
jgi:hypothetical protein